MAQMVENGTGLVSGQIEIHDAEYRPDRSLYDTIGGRAGADIGELANLDSETGRTYVLKGQEMTRQIENFPKPVIAAINGFALGGGTEVALACHVRMASDNAKMGQPEVKLGLIPGFGGTQRLARLVGKGQAMELILTGKIISAQHALQIGLVNPLMDQN